ALLLQSHESLRSKIEVTGSHQVFHERCNQRYGIGRPHRHCRSSDSLRVRDLNFKVRIVQLKCKIADALFDDCLCTPDSCCACPFAAGVLKYQVVVQHDAELDGSNQDENKNRQHNRKFDQCCSPICILPFVHNSLVAMTSQRTAML